MDLNSFIAGLDHEALPTIVPVLGGGLIVIGALLSGIVRGMGSGVVVALLIGAVLTLSPAFVSSTRPASVALSQATAQTAESAADLALLNTQALGDLGRAVASLNTAADGLKPAIASLEAQTDELVAAGFRESVNEAIGELEQAVDVMSRASAARQTLEDDLDTLQIEMRRANFRRLRIQTPTR